jgi:hypothetical protein
LTLPSLKTREFFWGQILGMNPLDLPALRGLADRPNGAELIADDHPG